MNEYRQNMERATIFFIINRHKIDGKFSLIRGLDSGSGSIFLYPVRSEKNMDQNQDPVYPERLDPLDPYPVIIIHYSPNSFQNLFSIDQLKSASSRPLGTNHPTDRQTDGVIGKLHFH